MSTTLVLTQSQAEHCQPYREPTEVADVPAREALLFEFSNCSKGLGIKICGGCSLDGEELYGVFIKRILPGGLADQEGGLEKGDQILEVNGESLEGVTNERAVSILRQACASNQVEMVITRDQQALSEYTDILERNKACSIPCTPVPTDPQQRVSELTRKSSTTSSSSRPDVVSSEHRGSRESPLPQGLSSLAPEGAVASIPGAQELATTPPVGRQAPVLNGDVSPKPQWRGLIPSMASTPNEKGSLGTGRSSGSSSQFSHHGTPSPVRAPRSFASPTEESGESVFEPSGATSQLPTSKTMSQSRKLSLDPYVRLKVEKLNSALRYLGLETTLEQEVEMRARLNIDASGTVNYGDFVEVVRECFRLELEEKNIGPGAMMFAASDFTDFVDPPPFHSETNGGASGVSQHELEVENEELRQDNLRLQVLLREKEDEILRIRKEAQGAIHEQRTLRSKVHLAAEAQKAARDMEHDYEEVVQLLEGEIAQLKLQLGKQVENDPIMQRRLAVLTCQLRKAESEKETFKVSTEKLLQFAETVHETLNDSSSGATSRPLVGAKTGGFLGKHKRPTPNVKGLATGAKDVVRTVKSLIDTQPLPFGWEECYTADGMKYYINHLNQVTTWSHPLSNVTHLPTIQDKKPKGADPKSSGSTEDPKLSGSPEDPKASGSAG